VDRLSRFDDKWPGQEKAQPIGAPPKGMWYDPAAKESKSKGISLNDAVKYFLENPTVLGKPAHIDMRLKMIELDNGSAISFDDIVQEYGKVVSNEKTSDFGFFDSPVDLGKDPKGDFPSVQWLPKGREDDPSDEDLVTSEFGLSRLDKRAYDNPLSQEQMNQVAAQYGAEYNSAVAHYYEAITNGHPQNRALDYAVAEMKKVGVTISPTILLEVTNTYLR
jgi:hypothetical protein